MASLKAVYQYDLWVLLAASWNFKHGPKDNDYRWHQLSDLSAAMRKKYTPHTCALFQERYPMLKKELDDMGMELPGEDPTDVEVWNVWKQHLSQERQPHVPEQIPCHDRQAKEGDAVVNMGFV